MLHKSFDLGYTVLQLLQADVYGPWRSAKLWFHINNNYSNAMRRTNTGTS